MNQTVTTEICDIHLPWLQLVSLFNYKFGSLFIQLPGSLLNMDQNILKRSSTLIHITPSSHIEFFSELSIDAATAAHMAGLVLWWPLWVQRSECQTKIISCPILTLDILWNWPFKTFLEWNFIWDIICPVLFLYLYNHS